MFFILALFLVTVFAILTASSLRITNRIAYIVALYILASANVILVGEIAGTIHLLSSILFFLSAHAVLLGLSYYFWRKRGQPPLFDPFSDLWVQIRRISWKNMLLSWFDILLLALAVGAGYLVCAFLILKVAPNSADAMTTYMARVGYWLQHGTFSPWEADIWTQVSYPFNPQIEVLWTVLLWGTDRFAAFPQWMGAVFSVVSIVGICRVIGWSRPQAAFAGLVWATFPEIILEATSTQTDLVTTGYFIAMVYLFYRGMKEKDRISLALSGVTMGLALGAKHLILILIPGLALTVFLMLWIDWKRNFKPLFFWASACLIGVLLFGAYTYVFNLVYFKGPLGPLSLSNVFGEDEVPPTLAEISRNTATGFFRLLYQMPDLSGLPEPVASFLLRYKVKAANHIFGIIPLPVQSGEYVLNYARNWAFSFRWRPSLHEHHGWYGPVSFLLLFLAFCFQLWQGLRQRNLYVLGLIAMSLSALFFLSYRQKWGGVEGRYLIIGVTVLAPLAASLVRQNIILRIFRFGVVALAILVLGITTTNNVLKPLFGWRTIWGLDRIDEQTIYNTGFAPTTRMVDQLLPPGTTLGVANFFYDYYLFGEHFERKIIPIVKQANLNNADWLEQNHIDAILNCTPTPVSLKEYGLIGLSGTGSSPCALHYKGASEASFVNPASLPVYGRLFQSTEMPVNRPIMVVDSSLAQLVSTGVGFMTSDRGIENCGAFTCLWLARGSNQGFQTILWSKEQRPVQMNLSVSPGSDAGTLPVTMELDLNNRSGKSVKTRKLVTASTISLLVTLEPGPNEINLFVQESKESSEGGNPAGPLQVFLQNITIEKPDPQSQAGPENSPLVSLGKSLSHVSIDPYLSAPIWGIEKSNGGSWLWLGHGTDQGLSGALMAEAEVKTQFIFDVYPGPARADSLRTVELTVEQGNQVIRQRSTFDAKTSIVFDVTMLPGENKFTLAVLDEPNPAASNSDSRPLLVCVQHLTVDAAPVPKKK